MHGFDKSARKLGVDQIDLLILHRPLPAAFDRALEAYRALETLLADARSATIHTSRPAEPLVEAEHRTGRGLARGVGCIPRGSPRWS